VLKTLGALSLLWPEGPQDIPPIQPLPPYFSDLRLDHVVATVTAHRDEADFIRGLHVKPLRDGDTVRFRQEIFQDIDGPLLAKLPRFLESMRQIRQHVSEIPRMTSAEQREGWLLHAAGIYVEAVRTLAADLDEAAVRSRGLLAARDYLRRYLASDEFQTLGAEIAEVQAGLQQVRYCVRIRGGTVEVRRYEGEPDYSVQVLDTFRRFEQGAVKDYRVAYRFWPGMTHVAAQIAALVARLFPDPFSALHAFCTRHAEFVDPGIRQLAKELPFYVSYLEYIAPIRAVGLPFCYPEIAATSKQSLARDTFDVVLARIRALENRGVVPNDFHLEQAERIIVISGPNQGGKTTFARAFGQIHHLARIGVPVPGTSARLFLCDEIFTHFPKEDSLSSLRGKLEDDIVRMAEIFRQATSESLIILNETFSSTTLHDARFLGEKAMAKLVALDALACYVTFVDELAAYGPSVVSMVSTVVPDNPSERTYRVVRAPANGLAYALALAEKHGVTLDQLRERLARAS
jgi:DNA mismatch repair protein MutS